MSLNRGGSSPASLPAVPVL